MENTTLFDQRVYAQDTVPSDLRDGNLWVDTSKEPPVTKVYAVDTDTWEPTAPGNVTVSDSQPTGKNEGHIWADTSLSPPKIKIYDGSIWKISGPKIEATGSLVVGGVNDTDRLTQVTRGKTGETGLYNLSTSTFLGELTSVTNSKQAWLQATTAFGDSDYEYQFTAFSQ